MPEYLSEWNIVTFLFLLVCVALTISAHKKAWYVSAAIIAGNFIAGHFIYGGFGWLTLLNFFCLAFLLIMNRAVSNKWFSACSILIYSVVIDILCFIFGMSFGAANIFTYVWAGIVFNLPKLYFTLPIAFAWSIAEFLTARRKTIKTAPAALS